MPDLSPDRSFPVLAVSIPRIRTIDDVGRPWRWLEAGWRDLRAAPLVSFALGGLAVATSYLLVWALMQADLLYLVLPLAGGFLLMAPLLATGLYEISRLTERGEPVSIAAAFAAFQRNAPRLATMGVILTVTLLVWIRLAFLVFALFFGAEPPALDQIFDRIFFSAETVPFLVTGTLLGAVPAAVVFSISVVSIPMLLDRDVSVLTAMATSVQAVRFNPRLMAGWAALIALITAAGMTTAFVGLALAFPLIGHATWHAYRDLIVSEKAG